MKFEDAWEEVFTKLPIGSRPADPRQAARIISLLWSILAVAMNKEGTEKGLDDLCYISDTDNIISIPIEKSTSDTGKKTTGKKKATKKKKDAKPVDDKPPVEEETTNGEKEEESKEPTTESKE